MARSTLPLFPTDDGWPYPDLAGADDIVIYDAEPDLDALELVADRHAFDALSPAEHKALFLHFGLDGDEPVSMKLLGPALGCTRTEARDILGSAIVKVRMRLRMQA